MVIGEMAGVKVVLLVKRACSACGPGKFVVQRAAERLGAAFEVVHIDEKRELRQKYGFKVPVVLVNDEVISTIKTDERLIKKAIEVALAGQRPTVTK